MSSFAAKVKRQFTHGQVTADSRLGKIMARLTEPYAGRSRCRRQNENNKQHRSKIEKLVIIQYALATPQALAPRKSTNRVSDTNRV